MKETAILMGGNKEKYVGYPKISIIVLTWNGKEDMIKCLNSLKKLKYSNYKVIVVDNNSEDNSVSVIRRDFPDIKLIVNDRNYGYAEGNNIGIRYAAKERTDYFLLLNSDTVVDCNCLNELIKVSQKYPDGGIFGPKTYLMDNHSILYSAGLKFNPLTGRISNIGMNEIDDGKYEKIQEFDIINGHAMLIKREVIDKIGLLDRDYFAYNEETDYCIRASKSGFKMVYVPKAIVFHKGEASKMGALRQYLIKRNHLLCMRKNCRQSQLFLFYFYFFLIDLPNQILKHIMKKEWDLIFITLKAVGWNFGLWKSNFFEQRFL